MHGWLFLTSCKKYVDFKKVDFDSAYNGVVSEINWSKSDRRPAFGTVPRSTASETGTAK